MLSADVKGASESSFPIPTTVALTLSERTRARVHARARVCVLNFRRKPWSAIRITRAAGLGKPIVVQPHLLDADLSHRRRRARRRTSPVRPDRPDCPCRDRYQRPADWWC